MRRNVFPPVRVVPLAGEDDHAPRAPGKPGGLAPPAHRPARCNRSFQRFAGPAISRPLPCPRIRRPCTTAAGLSLLGRFVAGRALHFGATVDSPFSAQRDVPSRRRARRRVSAVAAVAFRVCAARYGTPPARHHTVATKPTRASAPRPGQPDNARCARCGGPSLASSSKLPGSRLCICAQDHACRARKSGHFLACGQGIAQVPCCCRRVLAAVFRCLLLQDGALWHGICWHAVMESFKPFVKQKFCALCPPRSLNADGKSKVQTVLHPK